ncbi:MAG: AMP-dependent synthetase/ligase [Planctomycetota bacterium]|jgi:long-chain acyl-CoA synthetase|nr:AMP-dependent synthetase/ligase [Planctomycetota bacterium]
MNGPTTLLQSLFDNAKRWSATPALRYKTDGVWHDISWENYAQRVLTTARGLRAIGLQPGDMVAILSTNRVEWLVGDLGALALGCITVPVYPNSIPQQIQYILEHCGAKAIYVENRAQADKVLSIRDNLPDLKTLIVLDGSGPEAEGVMNWEALIDKGAHSEASSNDEIQSHAEKLLPQSEATIVYTSGTTGPPKGAVLSHGNIMAMAASLARAMNVGPGDSSLSFLPLSHIAERLQGEIMAIRTGYTVNIGEGLEHVAANLVEVEPTLLVCVPRLWEKYYSRIKSVSESATGLRKKLFAWARSVGTTAFNERSARGQLSFPTRIRYRIADRIVLGPLRKKLGMGKSKSFISGAAPLSAEVGHFFASLGIPIQEVYGQTECVGVCTFNPAEKPKFGTVGIPLEGMEIQIADDGEILVHGPNVFLGYFRDEKATAETVVNDWLHTGDVGEMDPEGYVRITDRKKDIIVTAGGKNVSPQNIENRLKTFPGISQVVVVGDKRKFLSALITLDREGLSETWEGELPEGEALTTDPTIHQRLQGYIDEANQELASYETVKKFSILPEDFTVDSGELTPSLKVKRRIIQKRYEGLIDAFYEEKFE